jgi:hypothetical protein
MLNWLKSIFAGPEPAGPPGLIRQFRAPDPTLTKDRVTVAEDGWVVDAPDSQSIRWFEIAGLQIEQCLLTYRARMKTEAQMGGAYLEMWCRVPGRGEFFSKGLEQAVSETTDWASYEVLFRLRKGQKADLVKLNLVIEGHGRVCLKAPELLKTPMSS